MIIYRPHMLFLSDSIKEAKVFKSKEEMFKHIVKTWGGFISMEDLSVSEPLGDDERIGWRNYRHVLTRRCGNQNYMEMYGCPQCIGMCSEDYEED